MADPFFFCADLAGDGERVRLTPDESRHLRGARRYRLGDELWLFDGMGVVARGQLVEAGKSGAWVEIHEREREAPPSPAIHLACALPKGDRQATLLEMATQLGMTSFTPLTCERSITKSPNCQRLQRICLEACKQSRRAYMPELCDSATPQDYVLHARHTAMTVWIAHADTEAMTLSTVLRGLAPKPSALALMVGPEGGFSPSEMEVMKAAGGQSITLGPAVLRVEAAANAALAAIRLMLDDPRAS